MTLLTSSYDFRLVGLSVVIAILAAGAALDLAGRVTAASGRARGLWLAGGAFAMGLGIWSMHYTGMLAFRLPVPIQYHVPTVALSLLAAVFASGVALLVASGEQLSAARVAVGSAVMGAGIAAMHYIGMAAMRLPAVIAWNVALVLASVVIAVGVSAVALWLAFRYAHNGSPEWTWRKLGSALVMGGAISSMHYVGMAAARFSASEAARETTTTIRVAVLGPGAVSLGTLVVLAIAIATSILDRRTARQSADRARTADALRATQARLHRLLAASNAVVYSVRVDGETFTPEWVSDNIHRVMGYEVAEALQPTWWLDHLHPEDRTRVLTDVPAAFGTGELTTEYRFQHGDGRYRWIHDDMRLVRDAAGTPRGAAGVWLDITERKLAEENQQFLVRELRAAAAEVKTLRGWLRVCANCKRVLTDQGGWEQIESYVRAHSEVEFSHGICPDCAHTVWGTTSE